MQIFSWTEAHSPIIVAHRGGMALAEENSLEALRASAALGVHVVELDVHELSDGTLVVYHNWRLPGDRQWVADATADMCRKALGAKYLELQEVFAEAKRLGLGIFLDVKGMTTEGQQRMQKLIDSDFNRESIVILSFQADIPVRAADAGYRAAIAYRDRWADPIRMAQTPVQYLQPVLDDGHGFETLTKEYVDRVHQRGKKVISWTAHNSKEVAAFLNLGCDAVLADDPQLILNLLQSNEYPVSA